MTNILKDLRDLLEALIVSIIGYIVTAGILTLLYALALALLIVIDQGGEMLRHYELRGTFYIPKSLTENYPDTYYNK